MLSEIRLESFKSFNTKQYAPLAPLTLIYGPNSSGKSSILQSLLLLKQSLVSARSSLNVLDFNGHLADLGDFRNTVFQHANKPLQFGISFTTDFVRGNTYYTLPPNDAERSASFRFAMLDEAIRTNSGNLRSRHYVGLEECTYRLGSSRGLKDHLFNLTLANADQEARKLGLRYQRDREQHFFRIAQPSQVDEVVGYLLGFFHSELNRLESQMASKRTGSNIAQSVRRKALRELLLGSLFSTTDFLPSVLHRLRWEGGELSEESTVLETQEGYLAERYGLRTDLLSRFSDEIRRLMDRIAYIGPFRRPPERIEILREREASTVGRSGEYFHYMLYGQDRRAIKLNRWLKRLEVPYNVELVHADLKDRSAVVGKVVQIRYHDNRFNTDVSATDIGFGIGQIIPVIVEGILSRNKMILVEQPELHLHPKLQADFADLLLDTCFSKNENPEGNQWIIETHSELMLLRILRRIREGSFKASNLKVLYVEPPDPITKFAGSQIFDLELSLEGKFLVPWPKGFFDEQGAEIFGTNPQ